jgi:hypothetical protein
MMEKQEEQNLVQEQKDFVLLLEKSVPPSLLRVVDFAYSYQEQHRQDQKIQVTYEGFGNV